MNNPKIQKERLEYAKMRIEESGFDIYYEDDYQIHIKYLNDIIRFFPYSGWFTSSVIKDGRGLEKLLKQLK